MAGSITRVDWARDWERQLWRAGEPALDAGADVILEAMKVNIPVSADGSHGRPAGYARSRLDVLERGQDGEGPYRDVGTDARTPDGDSYPAMLEHGTKAHDIVAKGPYPLRNRRTGQVFGRRVRHPGTKPIPWARISAAALNGRRL